MTWEYKTTPAILNDLTAAEAALNALGAQGWEIVSTFQGVAGDADRLYWVFMRALRVDKPQEAPA